jgi:hypothetical protein
MGTELGNVCSRICFIEDLIWELSWEICVVYYVSLYYMSPY